MIGGVTRSGLPLIYLGSPTPCKQGLSKWKGEEGGGLAQHKTVMYLST